MGAASSACSICCCCRAKQERAVDDLLDGSLEDKLLGGCEREDDVVTMTEEDVWRQRRQHAVEEELELTLGPEDDSRDGPQSNDALDAADEEEDDLASVWDLSDRVTVRAVNKPLVAEDEDDEESYDSAKEEEEVDRLGRVSARSTDDSYASDRHMVRGNETQLFRDELDRADLPTGSFLASTSPSSQQDDDDDVGYDDDRDSSTRSLL